MGQLTVLLPNGVRVKVTTSPRMTLLKVLESACAKYNFDSEVLGLRRSGTLTGSAQTLDLSVPLQYSGIPNAALLETIECKREVKPCTIALQTPSGRFTSSFSIKTSLWDVLKHWDTEKPDINLTNRFEATSVSGEQAKQSRSSRRVYVLPACRYLRDDIDSLEGLINTTLKDLGLNGGKALVSVRFVKTELSEDDTEAILAKSRVDLEGTEGKDIVLTNQNTKATPSQDYGNMTASALVPLDIVQHESEPSTPESATCLQQGTNEYISEETTSKFDDLRVEDRSTLRKSEQVVTDGTENKANKFQPKATEITNEEVVNIRMNKEIEVSWHAEIADSSRDRLRNKLLNAALQGLPESDRESRRSEFVARVSKVEDKIFMASNSAEEYYSKYSDKIAKIKLRNMTPDPETIPIPTNAQLHGVPSNGIHIAPKVTQSVDSSKTKVFNRQTKPKENTFLETPAVKPMIIPERNCKVLRVGVATGIAEDNTDDSFYDLKPKELKKMLDECKKAYAPSDAPLLTKYLRDKIEEEKISRFNTARIRVVFPDKYVLQFTCHPKEEISAITSIIKEYLENVTTEFYIYTTPPKKVLKDAKETLASAGLVPRGVLRIGSANGDDIPQIKVNLKEKAVDIGLNQDEEDSPQFEPPTSASATEHHTSRATNHVGPQLARSRSTNPSGSRTGSASKGKGGSQFLRLSR